MVGRGYGLNQTMEHGRDTTDADGRFLMRVFPDMAYAVSVKNKELVGHVSPVMILEGKPVRNVEITAVKGTVIRGRATEGEPAQPVSGLSLYWKQELGEIPAEIDALRKEGDRGTLGPMGLNGSMRTDENGEFRFVVGAGKHELSISRGGRSLSSQEVNIDAGEVEKVIRFDVPVEKHELLSGVVRDEKGAPVADARIIGHYRVSGYLGLEVSGRSDVTGRFGIEREPAPVVILVRSKDRSLARLLVVDGETKELEVKLKPTYQAVGRLVNEHGKPHAGIKVQYATLIKNEVAGLASRGIWGVGFSETVKTDDEGNFLLENLVQGVEYEFRTSSNKLGQSWPIASFQHNKGTALDLGEKEIAEAYVEYLKPK